MTETKYEPKYEHIRVIYKLKKGKTIEELSQRFDNWVSSAPRPKGEWQIGLWGPVTGENPIAVSDLEITKKEMAVGPILQTKGLNGLLNSWEIYYLIHSRAFAITKNDVKGPNRNLIIFEYAVKSIPDFLDWVTPFWSPNYGTRKKTGNMYGVEMVGIYSLKPAKRNILSCQYHICNFENWTKKSAEMGEALQNLVDPSKTQVEVYSLISYVPDSWCVLTRSFDYTFERIEREKRERK